VINNIDKQLNNSNEIIPVSTDATSSSSSSTDEINRLKQLKKDIIQQTIITNREIEEGFDRIIQAEQEKFSVKNRYTESTSEWQKIVFDSIEQRRLYMITRANFILDYKLVLLMKPTSNNTDNTSVILQDLEQD
jgi:alpha-D-ribose 1-methylphosphonate 5-triphosphate synthase subunit PhnL